jgi:DnaJ domain
MQLPGRLASSTLGDLLGALHRERITGQLELVEVDRSYRGEASKRHRIHFTLGLVTFVESDAKVPPLGEILRREGLIGGGALGRVLERIHAGDRRAAGEILVAEGLARPEFVRAGLRKQVKQRLDALFGIEDAWVTFHAFSGAGGGASDGVSAAKGAEASARARARSAKVGLLWPSDFLHGRPRMRDRRSGGRGAANDHTPPTGRVSGAPFRAPPSSQRPFGSSPEGDATSRKAGASRDPAPDVRARARRMLGLTEGASQAEVRRAFRKIAAELHPDRFMGAPAEIRRQNADRFAQLSAAYHLLVA